MLLSRSLSCVCSCAYTPRPEKSLLAVLQSLVHTCTDRSGGAVYISVYNVYIMAYNITFICIYNHRSGELYTFVYIMYILWHIMYLLYVYTITDLARTQMIDGSEGSHEVFDLLNHVAGLHADGATVLMIPSNKKNCLYEMIYRMR